MADKRLIAILPGDGIGPEVTEQAVRVIECINATYDAGFEIKTEPESEAKLVEVDLNNILSSEDILSLVKTEFGAFTNQFDIKDEPQYEQNEFEIKEESDFIQPGDFCTNLFVGIKEGPSGLSPMVNTQTYWQNSYIKLSQTTLVISDIRSTTVTQNVMKCKCKCTFL